MVVLGLAYHHIQPEFRSSKGELGYLRPTDYPKHETAFLAKLCLAQLSLYL